MTKINLLLDNPKGQLNGYLNIDVFADENKIEGDTRIKGDVYPLDAFVDNGECEEIIARHILCYFPTNVIGNALNNWMQKIAINGKLIIEEMDLGLLADAITWEKITMVEALKNMYGKQDKNWNIKKSGVTISSLINFLEGSGFKILKKRINGINFTILASR